MKDELFSIGPFVAHGYGLFIAIGVIAAYVVAEFRAKKRSMDPDIVFEIAIRAALGGLIGAKLLFFIVEIKEIIAQPRYLLDSLTNGWVVYGGLVFGTLWCILYLKRKKLNPLEWFDLIMPEIALGQAFGRIGCLMAGCCYGKVTESHFHIEFKESLFAPNHVWLYPTQIMFSVANLISFLLLVFVVDRKFKKKGCTGFCFFVFYSVGRFVLEFFRGDIERGAVGVLSTSQFISLFIFAFSVVCFILILVRPENAKAEELTENVTETSQTDSEETETQN